MLGASNLTYAEATWTQQLPDWTGAHVRMFRFFGGVPKLLVCDNLKSGVNKVSFYDPEINRAYGAMAAHYSVAGRQTVRVIGSAVGPAARAAKREAPADVGIGFSNVTMQRQDLIGSREPTPLGVSMVSHVPFATYFQALPW